MLLLVLIMVRVFIVKEFVFLIMFGGLMFVRMLLFFVKFLEFFMLMVVVFVVLVIKFFSIMVGVWLLLRIFMLLILVNCIVFVGIVGCNMWGIWCLIILRLRGCCRWWWGWMLILGILLVWGIVVCLRGLCVGFIRGIIVVRSWLKLGVVFLVWFVLLLLLRFWGVSLWGYVREGWWIKCRWCIYLVDWICIYDVGYLLVFECGYK